MRSRFAAHACCQTSTTIADATIEFAYDVLGNLVAVANGEESFEILVDNGHSLADVAADGRTLRVYMRAPGVDNWLGFVDMTGSSPVPYFYVTDHLGSVLAVTDANGNLVERYEYDAWGKVLSVTDANGNALARSAIGNRILWQGREYSWTTSLYYFRNRWYDPVIGRWISKDPIGINGGINLYQFCAGNPVCCRDPSGWCTEYGNPQEEKNKIKALRNGWNGMSLPYAIEAGIVMHGNGVGEAFGLHDRPEWPRMDYATQKGVGWKFEDTIRRNDMMGNYMAGYAAGYSDYPTILYLGVRAAGIKFAAEKKGIEGLAILNADADSVPDILEGFADGSREFAKDHPFRSAIRAVTTPKILPVLLFLDSLY